MVMGNSKLKQRKILFVLILGLGIIWAVGEKYAYCAEKLIYPKDPQACANCHIIKPYVESWKKSDFLDHKHQRVGINCLDCHQLTIKKQRENISKFKKRTFKTPFDEREYGNSLCFNCHGSYQEIIERTKDYKNKDLPRNPHESHYGEMDCHLCHKAHRPSIDYCSQCHQPGVKKAGWKTLY